MGSFDGSKLSLLLSFRDNPRDPFGKRYFITHRLTLNMLFSVIYYLEFHTAIPFYYSCDFFTKYKDVHVL